MKTLIYLVTIALVCIGFSACEKESDSIEIENFDNFFKYQSKSQVPLSTVIEHLKEKNDSIPFTKQFEELYGKAIWDENITVENSDGFVILVPVLSNDKTILTGIWMFNHYDNLMNYGVILNDEDVRIDKLLDYSFAYFEQELLGLNEKLKFEDIKKKDYNSLTKDGYIIENCNIIFAGNNNIGWDLVGYHCWETYEPGTNTNRYLDNGYTDQVGGGSSGMDGSYDGGGGDPYKFSNGTNYETLYPKLTEYLKNQISKVALNPRIMTALKGYGQFTDQQIIENLKWGNGPIIEILDISKVFGKDAYGIFSSNTPDRLYLDINLAKMMENASGINSEAFLFLVAITILHETVHLGDFNYDQIKFDFEAGNAYERYVYGRVIGIADAQKHIQLWIGKE